MGLSNLQKNILDSYRTAYIVWSHHCFSKKNHTCLLTKWRTEPKKVVIDASFLQPFSLVYFRFLYIWRVVQNLHFSWVESVKFQYVLVGHPDDMFDTWKYRRINPPKNKLLCKKKLGALGINGIIGTNGKWKSQNPGGCFGATS